MRDCHDFVKILRLAKPGNYIHQTGLHSSQRHTKGDAASHVSSTPRASLHQNQPSLFLIVRPPVSYDEVSAFTHVVLHVRQALWYRKPACSTSMACAGSAKANPHNAFRIPVGDSPPPFLCIDGKKCVDTSWRPRDAWFSTVVFDIAQYYSGGNRYQINSGRGRLVNGNYNGFRKAAPPVTVTQELIPRPAGAITLFRPNSAGATPKKHVSQRVTFQQNGFGRSPGKKEGRPMRHVDAAGETHSDNACL